MCVLNAVDIGHLKKISVPVEVILNGFHFRFVSAPFWSDHTEANAHVRIFTRVHRVPIPVLCIRTDFLIMKIF